jgi:hypothetical protein
MTKKNNPQLAVINFMQRSAEDKNLQQLLQQVLGVGDGNISNKKELDQDEMEAIKGEKGAELTEFARSQGFNFSVQDLQTVVQAFEDYRERKISDVALFKILGIARDAIALLSTQKIINLFSRGRTYQKVVSESSTTEKRSHYKIAAIKFMQQSGDNEIIQKRLEKILGVGDGDISNENKLDKDEAEALKGKQGVKFIEFAREQGFDFSLQDLIDVVEAFENYREGKISDLELFQILELSADNVDIIPSLKVQEVSYRGQRYIKIDGVSIPIYTTRERKENNLKTDEDTFFG